MVNMERRGVDMLANINHKKSYCPGANMVILAPGQQMKEVMEDSVWIQRAEKGNNRERSVMFITADFLHCSVYFKDLLPNVCN